MRTTSCPLLSSAAATPSPVRRETSRSALIPPIRTPTRRLVMFFTSWASRAFIGPHESIEDSRPSPEAACLCSHKRRPSTTPYQLRRRAVNFVVPSERGEEKMQQGGGEPRRREKE